MGDFVQQFYIKPKFKGFIIIIVFAMVFFGLGVLGIQTQSVQHGINLFWPVSGLILAAFFIYGFWIWPGILLGFGLFAYYIEVPLFLALFSGIVAIVEASVAITIAQKYNFKGDLKTFKDCLIFGLITIVSPIFSSVLGSLSFYLLSAGKTISPLDMMLLWWLGNSLGILLMGGTLLSFYSVRHNHSLKYRLNEKIALLSAVGFVFVLVYSQKHALDIALMVNFIIPVIFIGALRFGACGASFLGLVFVVLLSLFSGYSQQMILEQKTFDFQYLILVKIWFVCIAGVLIAGAFNDSVAQGRLEWLALHDGLTGLFNRTAIGNEIDLSLKGLRATDNNVCLLFLDVDHFKPINDQLGHKKGDEVLAKIAQVLKSTVRNIDVVSRWGGDEFLILLRHCNEEQAMEISKKILNGVKALSFSENNHHYPLSMSIGISCMILGESKISFIERADAASYEAKHNGKNQAIFS